VHPPVAAFFLDILTCEDRTDMLSQNVSNKLFIEDVPRSIRSEISATPQKKPKIKNVWETLKALPYVSIFSL
jgi:hypothetical protein